MPRYVDGFVLPIPKKNVAKYRKIAAKAARVWKEHGALEYVEGAGDDFPTKGVVPFTRLARAKKGETVVFAFIVYKSKAHRDRVNAKVMADPRMQEPPDGMPFDVERMAYGGFRAIVDR